MKILVAIKRVVDPSIKIRVKADESAVETANVKMAINPFCEIALEEALRLQEQGVASEVVVVSIGDQTCQESLRQALAMGAERAIHIQSDQAYSPLNIAKILRAVVDKETPGLILMGKQSIDGDNNQTGQMLAGLLNWAQGTFASKLEKNDEHIEVTREVDSGLETVSLKLPAVITTDLRLNEPRYVTLPNIMKAKRKPIDALSLNDLGLDLQEKIKTIAIRPPQVRQAGVKLESAADLVDKLHNEAKVI